MKWLLYHVLFMGILWQILSMGFNPFFHIKIHMNVLEMIWEKVPHFTN
jgi:hypothetical protein